jgi:hypothetical protein
VSRPSVETYHSLPADAAEASAARMIITTHFMDLFPFMVLSAASTA